MIKPIKKLKKQARVLTPGQLEELFTRLHHPYDAIAKVAYYTGSRIGEIIALKIEHVTQQGLVIPQHKTSAEKLHRWIPQTKDLCDRLVELSINGWLFPSSASTTGHLGRTGMHNKVKDAAELLEFDGVSTHTFRRSLATNLYKEGMPLEAIRKITGHSTVTNLMIYIGIADIEAAEQHAEIMARLHPVAG